MMGRRGLFLAEETLKIVIALISLGFLIYFLAALYFTSQSSEELEFAEASLTNILNNIGSQSFNVEVYNPEGWTLNSYSIESENFQQICSGFESCLCFCENEDCSEEKICMESEFRVREGIEIENPPVLLRINYENKEITSNGP